MAALEDSQRAQLHERLVRERARTAARVAALSRDLDDMVTASAEAVRDDEHDPEGATIAFERSQVAALLDDARARLVALERATHRLDEPDAGRCRHCAAPIGFERLLARPAATTCIACARRGV